MSRRRKRRGKARKGPSAIGRFFQIALLLLLLGGIAAGAGLLWLWPRCSGAGCPSVEALREYTPPQASRVLDRDGELVARLAPEMRIVVPLEKIPANVTGAFLAVEDRRFYDHDGVDYRRVVGAAVRDLRSLSFDQGFSTITMQLARNVFPEHLTREKTLRRKVWEVKLAREIEQSFPKDQILEMYLNQIYLGDGLYGVEAAAKGYFGKDATELTHAEAATLAALPKAPSFYNPRRNPEDATERRDLVLDLMADAGYISPGEAREARDQPLGLVPPPEAEGEAPYFVAAVKRELLERFGNDAETAGLRVYTTLDVEMQRTAERQLRRQIEAVEAGAFGTYRHPSCAEGVPDDPDECLQGMFVALDARTGDVRALVGGRDFALSQFDRVTQAKRQAGSAFKPIVYATALAAGIPVSTPLVGPGAEDALVRASLAGDSLTQSSPGGYRPADHVSDSLTLNLREGLRVSSNRAAVALGERVGVTRVVQTAHDLGISTPIQEFPSTFLGAADVIPLEMVAAYTAFANGGRVVAPRLIRRVEDSEGRVLWEQPVRAKQVLSPTAAYLTVDLMEDVVNRGTGSGVRAAGLPYTVPAAGKTGTTNEAADVWFVGVTPELVAGVWLGFDQPQRILRDASGGALAAPVWGRVMAEFYSSHVAPAPWTAPAELVARDIDRETGMLATAACPPEQVVTEGFIPGTEPTDYCELHPSVGVGGWFERTLRGLEGWLGDEPEEPLPVPAAPRRFPEMEPTPPR